MERSTWFASGSWPARMKNAAEYAKRLWLSRMNAFLAAASLHFCVVKSLPRNFSIVLAFAGLSTITKLSCIVAI